MAFSPDGKYILGGNPYGAIYVWDVTTKEIKNILRGNISTLTDISFSMDGTTLVSRSASGEVLVWDFASILGAADTHN